jgi:cGMP-dependent protein kinase
MAVEINGEVRKWMSPLDSGFGELALLFNAPRSASIRAETTCFLWYIDRRTFKDAVEDVISTTYNENKAFIDKCPLLGELSGSQRQALADIAMSQYYEKNTKICIEGEQASSFYILKAGRICRKRNGGKEIDYIEKGQLFEH